MDKGARWMWRWQERCERRRCAGSQYGGERQSGRRDGRGCGAWTHSLEPSSGEWLVLFDGVLALIAVSGCVVACMLSMVQNAFTAACDTAVAKCAAGTLCGIGLLSARVQSCIRGGTRSCRRRHARAVRRCGEAVKTVSKGKETFEIRKGRERVGGRRKASGEHQERPPLGIRPDWPEKRSNSAKLVRLGPLAFLRPLK
jgi:hypothetical protein